MFLEWDDACDVIRLIDIVADALDAARRAGLEEAAQIVNDFYDLERDLVPDERKSELPALVYCIDRLQSEALRRQAGGGDE